MRLIALPSQRGLWNIHSTPWWDFPHLSQVFIALLFRTRFRGVWQLKE